MFLFPASVIKCSAKVYKDTKPLSMEYTSQIMSSMNKGLVSLQLFNFQKLSIKKNPTTNYRNNYSSKTAEEILP